MNNLELNLSDKIEGLFQKKVTKCNCFFINKAFEIIQISCDNVQVDFSESISKQNYKIINFCNLDGNLEIKYKGILDGTTGNYPYVIEKTSDSFYILRHETCYYPVFVEPNTMEYFDYLINPTIDDMFSIQIHINDGRTFCSNLEFQCNNFVGYNPTIAIGYFDKFQSFFGEIFYNELTKDQIFEIENVIFDVNTFMNKYKKAIIQDFRIIIIPENYGSFVLQNTLFITKDNCLNKEQLIHELIHTNWNPKCDDEVQRSRFFDEALTQYFTYRICDYYKIKSAVSFENEFKYSYMDIMNSYNLKPLPISKYGEEEMGILSYSFGVLALIELEKKIGKEIMDICLENMFKEFENIPINFKLFQSLFPLSTNDIFEEYIYTDIASKEILLNNTKKVEMHRKAI